MYLVTFLLPECPQLPCCLSTQLHGISWISLWWVSRWPIQLPLSQPIQSCNLPISIHLWIAMQATSHQGSSWCPTWLMHPQIFCCWDLRGSGGQIILIPMSLSCKHCLHHAMSSAVPADSLCFTSPVWLVLKPPQNLYNETKWDWPSWSTRQTWFKMPITVSASFTLWDDPCIHVDIHSRYFAFFFLGSSTTLADRSHWKPMYVNAVEKSTNFAGAQGQPSSSAIFQTSSAKYVKS